MADTPLIAKVLGFIAVLRADGFTIGPREAGDALAIIATGEPAAASIRARLRILLARTEPEWRRFDALFDRFWLAGAERRASVEMEAGASIIAPASSGFGARTRLDEGGGTRQLGPAGDGEEGPAGAAGSGEEALSRVDLAELVDARDIAEAERIARRLAAAMRRRLSRRLRAARRGTRPDLRRVIRASLASGGEPLELRQLKRVRRPVNLIVLLDVSGSMNAYTSVFLQFVRGLAGQWINAEVHLMHTRLVDATEALGERDLARSLARLTEISGGLGGGTRLGQCLAAFNRGHARNGKLRRAVVLVFSDGYDSGPEETFAREFATLAANVRRLVWLNPLKGRAAYRPITLAMNAALPHIDHFAAANTLASLAALEDDLTRLC